MIIIIIMTLFNENAQLEKSPIFPGVPPATYTYSITNSSDEVYIKAKETNEPGHAKMCLIPYANNKGADQPAHPRSLISAFVVRSLDSIISLVSRSEISRF